MKKESKNI